MATAYVAVGVTVLSWASAFVAIRHLAGHVESGPLVLGRVAVCAVILGVVLAVHRVRTPRQRRPALLPRGRQWAPMAVIGVGWFFLYHLALNQGVHYLDAGTAAMLVNTGPILIVVFAGLFLGEGFDRYLVGGVAVAFAGVLLITASSGGGIDFDWVGVVLCLCAALVYALSAVAQKPLLRSVSALQVTTWAAVIGAVASLPFLPALIEQARPLPATSLWLVGYLGAIPTALGFLTWAYALKRIDAGRMGAFSYLVPPAAIAISWLALSEVPAVLAMVGGALCLAGVAVTRRRHARA
ncbi:DMT family transporter [Haloechinothrix sp. LS1_15]|nr:DMT family transporter [Haloechinothrix sp. LS1_15]